LFTPPNRKSINKHETSPQVLFFGEIPAIKPSSSAPLMTECDVPANLFLLRQHGVNDSSHHPSNRKRVEEPVKTVALCVIISHVVDRCAILRQTKESADRALDAVTPLILVS